MSVLPPAKATVAAGLAVVLLGALGVPSVRAEDTPSKWSAAARDQAIDAAIATAVASPKVVTQANTLLELAIALKGADGHRVPEIIAKVHSRLTKLGHDYFSSNKVDEYYSSIKLVRQLVDVGDDDTAESFVASQPSKSASSFWKELALARVAQRNFSGAESAANHIDEPTEQWQALGNLAVALCTEKEGAGIHHARGLSIARRLESAARAPPVESKKQIENRALWPTANAIASCQGRDAVAALLKDFGTDTAVRQSLENLSHEFGASGQFDLARSLDPMIAPSNAEEAIRQARRLLLRNELDAARIALRRAAELNRGPQWRRDVGNDVVFRALLKLRLYDDAMILLPPAKACWLRAQDSRQLIIAAAADKDLRIVDALLQDAVECKLKHTQKRQHNETRSYLATLVTHLARAGLLERARIPYAAMSSIEPEPMGVPKPAIIEAEIAMGEGVRACRAYEETGALAQPPGALSVFLLAIMQGDADKSPPSYDVIRERVRRVEASAVAGLRASFLKCSIDVHLNAGKIDAALKVAKDLDAEPRDALKTPRNAALAAIASAFQKTGDPVGELAVASKMDEPKKSWPILMRLSTLPVSE